MFVLKDRWGDYLTTDGDGTHSWTDITRYECSVESFPTHKDAAYFLSTHYGDWCSDKIEDIPTDSVSIIHLRELQTHATLDHSPS